MHQRRPHDRPVAPEHVVLTDTGIRHEESREGVRGKAWLRTCLVDLGGHRVRLRATDKTTLLNGVMGRSEVWSPTGWLVIATYHSDWADSPTPSVPTGPVERSRHIIDTLLNQTLLTLGGMPGDLPGTTSAVESWQVDRASWAATLEGLGRGHLLVSGAEVTRRVRAGSGTGVIEGVIDPRVLSDMVYATEAYDMFSPAG